MTCNCNNTYPFPAVPCGSGSSATVGSKCCNPEVCYLKSNFTVLAANQATVLEVTDSSRLFEGQGIKLGAGYYQVTAINSSTEIEVKHNGLGVTVGELVVAVHPAYGCYQYPLLNAGEVSILSSFTPVGLNAAANTVVASSVVNVDNAKMLVSFPAPGRCKIIAEVVCDTANNPRWVAIPLPKNRNVDTGVPTPVFTGALNLGSGVIQGVGSVGAGSYVNHAIVGIDYNTNIADSSDGKFYLSGEYEYDV